VSVALHCCAVWRAFLIVGLVEGTEVSLSLSHVAKVLFHGCLIIVAFCALNDTHSIDDNTLVIAFAASVWNARLRLISARLWILTFDSHRSYLLLFVRRMLAPCPEASHLCEYKHDYYVHLHLHIVFVFLYVDEHTAYHISIHIY